MSVLTDLIYGGSNAVAGLVASAVNEAMVKYGAEREIAFPNTDSIFSTIYAFTGTAVKTLGDLPDCVDGMKRWITDQQELPQALHTGIAALLGAEILEGLKYAEGGNPYEGEAGMGVLPDTLASSLGMKLLSGEISGLAILQGKIDPAENAVSLIREYQARNVLCFLVGELIQQCAQGGVEMGCSTTVIPLGQERTAFIHAVAAVLRTALEFGGVRAGDVDGLAAFTKEKLPVVINTFGTIDAVAISTGAGAMALGFPVVVDTDLGENQIPGLLESVCDHQKTVAQSLSLRQTIPNT